MPRYRVEVHVADDDEYIVDADSEREAECRSKDVYVRVTRMDPYYVTSYVTEIWDSHDSSAPEPTI